MHRALADAADPQIDPDRRAWHRAQAAPGLDEEIAGELERSAGRAQARGGLAAAAAFWERSALLTADPARRAGRTLAAAQAHLQAGAFDKALGLLALAEAGPLDELARTRLDLLRGQIAFAQGLGSDAPALLLEAAKRLEPLNLDLARETYPEAAAGVRVYFIRGLVELARGRDADALAALRAAERLAGHLAAPDYLISVVRAWLLHAFVRLGETERAEQALAGLGDQDRDRGEMRIAAAGLRLAQHDPHAAAAALAPVLDGSASVTSPLLRAQPFLLEAIARDALGDPGAAERALERALDLAEPDGMLLPFLLHPAPGLLERHARHRTAHVVLIGEILSVLAGTAPASPSGGPQPLEPLSKTEVRVLRYLPTNLSTPEIARELYVSPNTVKTHMRNLYAKLGIHRRTEAVARARALGLLAPSPRRR